MKYLFLTIGLFSLPLISKAQILSVGDYKHYIDYFNQNDYELYKLGEYPNEKAWEFLSENIPLFDCPDKQLEETYYFRWWTYRKHIRLTPAGYIITEFLPDVGWAGKYNSICCPAAHHFMEGRWLRDPQYLKEYARFWFAGEASPRSYSFWAADAINNFCRIHPDDTLLKELFPLLDRNFIAWEAEKLDSTGLFWQYDNRDGMEVSVSGSYAEPCGYGYRATINSYMYADACALKQLAEKLEKPSKVQFYQKRADEIKTNINTQLWDTDAEFYKVIPFGRDMAFSDIREEHGYTPWYFNIPPEEYAVAWKFLMDTKYFYAPYGITTAEQCHPSYTISYEGHECRWDGPVWPFSTSVTLTALANLLNNYQQNYITKEDYLHLLTQYSRSHRIIMENGQSLPWIDENINPYTGDWISRNRLKNWKDGAWPKHNGGEERGKDYNHSTFNNLVISGLIGIRPTDDSSLIVNPLISEKQWEYFCLDKVHYKGKDITILFDKTGNRYKQGKGFYIMINGKQIFYSPNPTKAILTL